ncbi:tetracycline resistance MFS efflux pump [Viridibacillus sp. FSL R5-0477]|uniref:Tetracycline resistance protein n=1 Tax=Viridibacillus arenosi FSL R5-213 TaxID=1227360 RepID=W4F1H3_9BACL|nr:MULTISPECIES: tetracycline resistance MFS efflux pump [Viridibacillus]ETT86167.1 tetracycline resistance protein [Viridibacillus arenosi FSL R5-213]OMC84930.1 tetracycline resistance MFS efflux pump [Viridibacillus sp. FSL H8-0123]OMC85731.1 tetracycline resistance MFS efflux pump [Viridibacillus sp. FSL H7-0596]OMC91975.1 tetracycline resistance MFS efflux pump [Viridibacillus arenosi]
MVAISEKSSASQNHNVKKAVPIILLFFVFALTIDNSFKLVSVAIADDLGISVTTVSWQATLAGLVIGIGAVVYASLADSINIRTLLIAGVIMICAGSVMGYVFKDSYAMILFSRIIQTAGLASAETLYVIYVTKHLPKAEQKKFLGFSTSSYSLSLVIGSVTGGYVSTYLHWTTLFIIPLVTIALVPFIMKYLPKEKSTKSYVDVIGLFLIAAIATSVILFISNFNWLYLIGFIIAMTLFLVYISKSPKALIDISFFKNKNFIRTLSVAFVIYTVQLGYIFTFPFILEGVYGLKLDVISLLLIPGYITAIIVGMLSGKIAKYLSSKQAISIALIGIAASLLIPGLFVGSTVVIFVISMMLFSGSFAFMYAPMLETCIRTIPKDKSGTAIGFYNLTLNVAASIGITYTAAMLDKVEISTILIVLSIIAFVSLGLFVTLLSKLEKTN